MYVTVVSNPESLSFVRNVGASTRRIIWLGDSRLMDIAASGIPLSSCWIVSLVILSHAVRLVMYFVAPAMIDRAIDPRDSVKACCVAAEYGLIEDIFGMALAYY
ncbi:hypothetical protein J008_06848 [Cryptococcus neoformans]|nr:hypothetical protein J008_06848 [Cryptococcus neoformans var. grubii]